MPYAFTEQGVYMLMTVPIRQSIAIVSLFKEMKNYITTIMKIENPEV